MRLKRLAAKMILLVCCVGPVAKPTMADVLKSANDGFQISIVTSTSKDLPVSYQAFVSEFSKWWDASHSYSGKAENLSLDIKQHCLLESLPDGGFVRHMEISYFEKNKFIRMLGGLGPLQEMGVCGALTVEFKTNGDETSIRLTYNVTGASFQHLDQIAPGVDLVLAEQMKRYKKYCDSLAGTNGNAKEPDE